MCTLSDYGVDIYISGSGVNKPSSLSIIIIPLTSKRRGRLIRQFQGSQECHYCQGGTLEVAKRSYPAISPPHNHYYHNIFIIITITIINGTIRRRPSKDDVTVLWTMLHSYWGYLEKFVILWRFQKRKGLVHFFSEVTGNIFVCGRKDNDKYQHQNHQRHHIGFMISSVCVKISGHCCFLRDGLIMSPRLPRGDNRKEN